MGNVLDFGQLSSFFKLFGYKIITLQAFHKGRPVDSLAASFPFHDGAHSILQNWYNENYEVYFMVNEGDGVIYPPNKTARSLRNITRLTSLFIDTDNAPFSEVKAFLQDRKLKPHAVVESSPNKYHLYFLLSEQDTYRSEHYALPQLTEGQNHKRFLSSDTFQNWKRLQKYLACPSTEKHKYQADSSMRDGSRILRVPQFFHRKNESSPHLVRIVKEYSHPPYHLDELLHLIPRQSDLHTSHIQSSDGNTDEPYRISEQRVEQGARHLETTRFLASALTRGTPLEFALLAYYQYAQNTFDNAHEFLPKGKRHKEVLDFCDYKLAQLKEEEHRLKTLELEAILQTNSLNKQDPFQLSNDFYFNAPGIIGDMAKEICSNARYSCPPFAFAASLAFIGTLKSQTAATTHGHAPSNFFLCLGPSGSGKNYAQEVLYHTAKKLNLLSYMQSGLRSEKGLARFLETTEGKGLLILDEAETLFAAFQDHNTPSYMLQVKRLLLELYTSTNIPHKSLGFTGDKKQDPIILRYPQLNILFHGVMHTLTQAFDVKSIQDGLLQRFIVLTYFGERTLNPLSTPAKPLNGFIGDYIYDLILKSKFSSEKDFNQVQTLQAQLTAIPEDTLEKGDLIEKESILTEIQVIESKQLVTKRSIAFSPEAERLYAAFIREMDTRCNQEVSKSTGLEGLYTRAAEQVGRLAAVCFEDRVDSSGMEYLIEFVSSRVQATKHLVKEGMVGQLSKDASELKLFIARAQKDNDGEPVLYRHIVRYSKFRDSRSLNSILASLIDGGEITKVSTNSSGKGKRGAAYSI